MSAQAKLMREAYQKEYELFKLNEKMRKEIASLRDQVSQHEQAAQNAPQPGVLQQDQANLERIRDLHEVNQSLQRSL